MIQGSINQLLSLAAVAARLDPTVEARTEANKATKELSAIDKQIEQMNVTKDDIEYGTKTGKMYQEATAEKAEVTKRLFKAKPTKENYRKHLMSRSEPDIVTPADPDEIAQEQAELRAQAALAREQNRIANSKMTFSNREDR